MENKIGTEFERRFKLHSLQGVEGKTVVNAYIEQFYMTDINKSKNIFRCRKVQWSCGSTSYVMTVKAPNPSPENEGLFRGCFENEIVITADMYESFRRNFNVGKIISKTRHIFPSHLFPELKWEVDEFHGDFKGLYIAEIEMEKIIVGTVPSDFGNNQWEELFGKELTNASLSIGDNS